MVQHHERDGSWTPSKTAAASASDGLVLINNLLEISSLDPALYVSFAKLTVTVEAGGKGNHVPDREEQNSLARSSVHEAVHGWTSSSFTPS
jgi:hypothetical protein